MSKQRITDCTVIIRSVDERTEGLCKELATDVFPSENIAVITDRPFSVTLRRSLQFGLKAGLPWTFCLDADVLIDKDRIHELFGRAREESHSIFEIHGFVYDKFFNECRPAGNHLYRTEHLNEAIIHVPAEGLSLRPETTMIKSMHTRHLYNRYYTDLVIGIHDFEQYYLDIFSKGYLHANKHVKHLSRLLPYWKSMAAKDKDFEVLLWGISAGIAQTAQVFADKGKVPTQIFDLYAAGMQEKRALSISDFDKLSIRSFTVLKESMERLRPKGRVIEKISKKLSAFFR